MLSLQRVAALTAGLIFALPLSARAHAESDLISVFEEAPALVVGTVQSVSPLLHGAYLASLDVEQSLRATGDAPSPSAIAFAWAEPTPSLSARLVRGRRVLVGLESLGTASIWRERLPDAVQRGQTLALAARADAYLERPSIAELDSLTHYLALAPDARAGDAGVVQLAHLAATASPRLAIASIDHLRRLSGLAEHVTLEASTALLHALLRSDGGPPTVGDAVLALIEAQRPARLRDAIVARIEAQEPEVAVVLYDALGAFDRGLSEARSLALLASDSEERRLSAARWARGPKARARLRSLMRSDPAASVRAAAVARLITLGGANELPDAIRAFEDPAPAVRLSAARAIATIGEKAVPELRRAAESGSGDAAKAAIATLSLMGAEAHRVLAELAETHPDSALRTLSEIAVGRPIGHRH